MFIHSYMKFCYTLICLLISICAISQSRNYHSNIERGEINSTILGMNKSYQVFLPESYNYALDATYPVVYLIDGDYNFLYQTGVIESLSNVSEKIPELIVIGISDNGNEGYRKDCTIKSEGNPNGNATQFLQYIEEELKPEISKKYKTSTYDILIGHSLGGLFATNVLLEEPLSFNSYIAIDPSFWWDNYEIVSRADSLFIGKSEMEANLFLTLANTKQMGVHQFVGVVEKYFADSKKWTFQHYESETHGSVGLVSVRDGLTKIFEKWELDREEFYTYASGKEVMQRYIDISSEYDTRFRLPPFQLGNILYYYFRNEKKEDLKDIENSILNHFPASADDYYSKLGSYMIEGELYDEVEAMLLPYIESNKAAFKSYDTLSKLAYKKENYSQSKEYAEMALRIAKEAVVRQWQLNELESNLVKIESKM